MIKMDKNKEIVDVLEEKHKIKLGHCPYCDSTNYVRGISTIHDRITRPYYTADSCCNECGKTWTEYFGLDEIKYEDDEDEIFHTNLLGFRDKKTLLKAMDLLIKQEKNIIDHSRIINILNDKQPI